MKAYELIANGFSIKLDRNLYTREAVIKALYRFHEKYVISYETDGSFIQIFFETSSNLESVESGVKEIMKELSFQMIRIDTAHRTRGIRELLVARSLYATCIVPERESLEVGKVDQTSSWRDDQEQIFASWSAE